MTAKQYLQQSFKLNAKINANLLELERLRALSTCVASPDLSKDKVQTGSVTDRIGNTVAKIVDLEILIIDETDRLVDLKREIRERLEAIEDDDLRLVLQKRYVNFQKWEQIAVDMNYGYQWIHKLHKRALNLFSKKFQQAIESDT